MQFVIEGEKPEGIVEVSLRKGVTGVDILANSKPILSIKNSGSVKRVEFPYEEAIEDLGLLVEKVKYCANQDCAHDCNDPDDADCCDIMHRFFVYVGYE